MVFSDQPFDDWRELEKLDIESWNAFMAYRRDRAKRAEVRIACLGTDHKIRPAGRGYRGPPGMLFQVSPVQVDERGEYQLITYFGFVRIRVPPLHTWPEGSYLDGPTSGEVRAWKSRNLIVERRPRR